DVWCANQAGDDGVGDLVLDQVGRSPHPLGEDDDLDIRKIWHRVERRTTQRVDAQPRAEEDERNRHAAVPRAQLDEPSDHGFLQCGRASRSLASLDKRKVAPVATRSPLARPDFTSWYVPASAPTSTSTGSSLPSPRSTKA